MKAQILKDIAPVESRPLKLADLPVPTPKAGEILVKIAELGGISGIISVLANWLSRDPRRALKLRIGESELEVTGLSKGEQPQTR